jgi:tRNA 2-selenouridine synthase
MHRVNVHSFLRQYTDLPIVDVRSPGEFAEGHISHAINMPLFTDKERAQVGTTYTKVGREEALELGLEYVGPKLNKFAKKAKSIAQSGKIKVHCWRGGMRSEKMAWLFELIGLEVQVLEGGYKAYRNQLLDDFADLERIIVLQGPTGSGKTEVLHELHKMNEQILDLEGRANHKGSAFGAIGMGAQPTTTQFQNDLYDDLLKLDLNKRIWIESESLSIGRVYMPQTLWDNMNRSDVIELNVDEETRIRRIVEDYGKMDKNELKNAILKIRNRFGGNRVKEALALLENDQLEDTVRLLLQYYDKAYAFSKEKYKKKEIASLQTASGDPGYIAGELITIANKLEI